MKGHPPATLEALRGRLRAAVHHLKATWPADRHIGAPIQEAEEAFKANRANPMQLDIEGRTARAVDVSPYFVTTRYASTCGAVGGTAGVLLALPAADAWRRIEADADATVAATAAELAALVAATVPEPCREPVALEAAGGPFPWTFDTEGGRILNLAAIAPGADSPLVPSAFDVSEDAPERALLAWLQRRAPALAEVLAVKGPAEDRPALRFLRVAGHGDVMGLPGATLRALSVVYLAERAAVPVLDAWDPLDALCEGDVPTPPLQALALQLVPKGSEGADVDALARRTWEVLRGGRAALGMDGAPPVGVPEGKGPDGAPMLRLDALAADFLEGTGGAKGKGAAEVVRKAAAERWAAHARGEAVDLWHLWRPADKTPAGCSRFVKTLARALWADQVKGERAAVSRSHCIEVAEVGGDAYARLRKHVPALAWPTGGLARRVKLQASGPEYASVPSREGFNIRLAHAAVDFLPESALRGQMQMLLFDVQLMGSDKERPVLLDAFNLASLDRDTESLASPVTGKALVWAWLTAPADGTTYRSSLLAQARRFYSDPKTRPEHLAEVLRAWFYLKALHAVDRERQIIVPPFTVGLPTAPDGSALYPYFPKSQGRGAGIVVYQGKTPEPIGIDDAGAATPEYAFSPLILRYFKEGPRSMNGELVFNLDGFFGLDNRSGGAQRGYLYCAQQWNQARYSQGKRRGRLAEENLPRLSPLEWALRINQLSKRAAEYLRNRKEQAKKRQGIHQDAQQAVKHLEDLHDRRLIVLEQTGEGRHRTYRALPPAELEEARRKMDEKATRWVDPAGEGSE